MGQVKFRVLQTNLGRARASHDLAYAIALERNVDILIVGEPNKKLTRDSKWIVDNGQDVAVWFVSKKIKVNEIRKFDGFLVLILQKLTLICCYISPNIDISRYKSQVDKIFNEAQTHGNECIILGDINAKCTQWGAPKTDHRGEYWADALAGSDMIACNNGEPTFVRGASQSHIDVTCAKNRTAKKIVDWRTLDDECSTYHRPICFEVNEQQSGSEEKRSGTNINLVTFNKLLTEYAARTECGTPEALSDMLKRVAAKAKEPATYRKTNNPYWWNDDIANLRCECVTARRNLKNTRGENESANSQTGALKNYRTKRKALKDLINSSKRSHWEDLVNKLEYDVWGQGYSIAVKSLAKRRLPYNLTIQRKKRIVKDLFPNAGEKSWKRLDKVTDGILPFQLQELNTIAEKLKPGKAPGPDHIPSQAIKEAIKRHPDIFLLAMNNALKEQRFPKKWKLANVVLIPKQGKPLSESSSFRPICLLDCVGKVYETLIRNRIECELEENDGLSEFQFGFRKKRSTIQAMKWIADHTADANSKCVALVTIDVQNAFNTAPWARIVSAMKAKSISKYLICIIESYLQDRNINIDAKHQIPTTTGVPQGSVLGPTLWNIYYDAVLRLKLGAGLRTLAFADDLAVFVEADCYDDMIGRVNNALDTIGKWMCTNGLKVANHKSEAIILKGPRNKQRSEIKFKLLGATIIPKRSIRYLGITLDDRLLYGPHIREITSRAEEKGALMARIMPNIIGPRYQKRLVLLGVIQSILLYAAPVWSRALEIRCYKDMITKVQRRALLRVVCGYRTVSAAAAQVIAGVPPIDLLARERRELYITGQGHEKRVRVDVRNRIIDVWQVRWEKETVGSWTRKLIPDIRKWVCCEFRKTGYFFTQFLSGHGAYGTYTFRINKTQHDRCGVCDNTDSPAHAIFDCERWATQRSALEDSLNVRLQIKNFIPLMVINKQNFNKVYQYVEEIMVIKEAEDRANTECN